MKSLFIIPIFALLLLSGCAGKHKIYTKKSKSPYMGVDLEKKAKPSVGNNPLKEMFDQSTATTPKRKPVLSFHLASGEEKTLSLIGFFKKLEAEKIGPKILSGHGWGFLIAALLAKYEKSNVLEWKLLKLDHKLKKRSIPIYSKQGKKEILNFAENVFKNQKIENLNITVLLPIWDRKSRSYRIVRRGKVKKLIALALSQNYSSITDPKFSPYPKKKLESAGSDIPLFFEITAAKKVFPGALEGSFQMPFLENSEEIFSKYNIFADHREIGDGSMIKNPDLIDYIKWGEVVSVSAVERIKTLIDNWEG